MTQGKGARSRPPKRRAYRRRQGPLGSTRAALLNAAIAEFADKGYDGATTSGIARAAGVRQSLVHHYFGSKDELWHHAMTQAFSPIGQTNEAVLGGLKDLPPETVLRVLARQFVLTTARHPEVMKILVREGSRPSPRLHQLVETIVVPLVLPLEQVAQRGVADGWMKDLQLDLLLFVVLGTLTYLFHVPALVLALSGTDACAPATVERYADIALETLFHGILARTQPPKAA
jgi:AcrR family transcriptional regulator